MRYGIQGSLSNTLSISGEGVSTATISHLMFSTTYEIEVAAVNSAGIGQFSPVLTATTRLSEFFIVFVVFHIV